MSAIHWSTYSSYYQLLHVLEDNTPRRACKNTPVLPRITVNMCINVLLSKAMAAHMFVKSVNMQKKMPINISYIIYHDVFGWLWLSLEGKLCHFCILLSSLVLSMSISKSGSMRLESYVTNAPPPKNGRKNNTVPIGPTFWLHWSTAFVSNAIPVKNQSWICFETFENMWEHTTSRIPSFSNLRKRSKHGSLSGLLSTWRQGHCTLSECRPWLWRFLIQKVVQVASHTTFCPGW